VFEDRIQNMELPGPSMDLDDRFYASLAIEKRKLAKPTLRSWFLMPTIQKFAIASLTFILGLTAGYLIQNSPATEPGDLQALTEEVTTLKEMMMLSLLERESATDRLRAVSISQELDRASQQVTSALLQTLNNDENTNVRLAALEALKQYGNDSNVRTQLIESIAHQDSPLVQIALAELMASLQEKSSVKEFEKLLQNDHTPADVKNKIRERINVLI
jgi:hypothetical protein